MNLKNFLTLTIRVLDFNLVVQQPELMRQLRKLTLNPFSGMNQELNNLTSIVQYRSAKAKVLLAYRQDQLVGWALLSKEATESGYHPGDGILFELFIHPDYRQQGIGSELIKVARRKAGATRLCVVPWDIRSISFYKKFRHYKNKWLRNTGDKSI